MPSADVEARLKSIIADKLVVDVNDITESSTLPMTSKRIRSAW